MTRALTNQSQPESIEKGKSETLKRVCIQDPRRL